MNAQKEALASRRKMLVALGLTPALLAAIRAQASDERAQQSQGTRAEGRANAPTLDTYSVVAGRLWRTFELSVANYRKSPDDGTRVSIGADVFSKAQDLSGPPIKTNVDNGKFGPNGSGKSDNKTDECAVALGLFAATLATQSTTSPNVINSEIYELAFAFAEANFKGPKQPDGAYLFTGLAC